MGSEKVKLMSKEGDEFEITKDAAFLSFVIEDVFDKADPNDNEPTRLQVTSADLRQIVKWLEYHHENEETAENLKTMTPGAHSISVWDKEFFDSFQSKDEVFSLFEAANYMNIPKLIKVCAKYLAKFIEENSSTPEACFAAFDVPTGTNFQ